MNKHSKKTPSSDKHDDAALPAGEYVLKVYTRSGLGVEFGIKCVSRKVEIK